MVDSTTIKEIPTGTAPGNELVITALENALEVAREGKADAVSITVVDRTGQMTTCHHSGQNLVRLIGATSYLLSRMNKELYDDANET